MADYEGIIRQIQIKVNEAYRKGHKEGKEITEGAMKEEYQRGYKDALEAKEIIALSSHCDNLNAALDRGRDEAWELAKKIGLENGFGYAKLLDIFGTRNISEIFHTNTAQQAIEKVKAWEEKQKQDATDTNETSKKEYVWHFRGFRAEPPFECPKCKTEARVRTQYCPECGQYLHGRSDE